MKVRGYRIELGEIEAVLAAIRPSQAVVVAARERAMKAPRGGSDKRLVAYDVGSGAAGGELRRYVSERLPEYMVPAAYVAWRRCH